MAEAGSPETAVLREVPFLAQVEIRVDEEEAAAASRMAEGFLGCPLPAPGRGSIGSIVRCWRANAAGSAW